VEPLPRTRRLARRGPTLPHPREHGGKSTSAPRGDGGAQGSDSACRHAVTLCRMTEWRGRLRFPLRARRRGARPSRNATAAPALGRKAFFRLAETYMPLAVADLQQLLVIIPTADRHHDKVFWRGIKEEQPLLRAIAHLKEAGSDPSGRVVVDIG